MVGFHCEMFRVVSGININTYCLLITGPLILLWLTSIVIHLDFLLQIESDCLSLGYGAKSQTSFIHGDSLTSQQAQSLICEAHFN